jgi:hypothetical protein
MHLTCSTQLEPMDLHENAEFFHASKLIPHIEQPISPLPADYSIR